MKLAATITLSLQAGMQAELRDIERAVTTGTRDAGRGLKTELRRQVTSAGLGQRLANGWRDKHYPNQQLDPASLVYTKAPQIIRAFDEGAVIRSRRGRFLAIPTENAPRKGTDGKRIRPSTFPEHRFGPLRFVPRSSGPSLLVVDGLRASFSRQTGELRGFRRATDQARKRGDGLTTVVMFLLVPQVKLSKRLDVARTAERWSAQLPALIEPFHGLKWAGLLRTLYRRSHRSIRLGPSGLVFQSRRFLFHRLTIDGQRRWTWRRPGYAG